MVLPYQGQPTLSTNPLHNSGSRKPDPRGENWVGTLAEDPATGGELMTPEANHAPA